jgi:flavin-dependent dehydrogenase
MPDPLLDVLVAGAGPAGLAVALGAAQAGLDVVVCERRTGAGQPDGTEVGLLDKACGEGLMPGAVRALSLLGVDPPGHRIRGIAYRRGPLVARADFRDGPGRGVRRLDLHRALRDAVLAAGVPIVPRRVVGLRQEPDHVAAAGFRARYLVAADGLHSRLRAAAGIRSRPGPPRWGQRRHYALPPGTDFVEVSWAEKSEAYLTPVAEDVLGVAVLSSVRAPFDEQLAAFPDLERRLRGAQAVSAVRGAGPLRQRVSARVAGRVLLVGDAAGYVDALTGEGIGLALAAAAELVGCLVADRPGRYERAYARVSWRTRLLTSGLLAARRTPLLAHAVVPAAARLPTVFTAAVNQLAG